MEDHIKHISDLFLKELDGTITNEEKKELDEWKAASPDNQALYNDLTIKETFLEELKFYGQVRETMKGATQKIERFLAEQSVGRQEP